MNLQNQVAFSVLKRDFNFRRSVTRRVWTMRILDCVRVSNRELTMSPAVLRCRHYKVNWLSSHSCRCVDCGKHGHWFEAAGLVMWVRQESLPNSEAARPTGFDGLQASQAGMTLSGIAG